MRERNGANQGEVAPNAEPFPVRDLAVFVVAGLFAAAGFLVFVGGAIWSAHQGITDPHLYIEPPVGRGVIWSGVPRPNSIGSAVANFLGWPFFIGLAFLSVGVAMFRRKAANLILAIVTLASYALLLHYQWLPITN